jgi:outer membrane protein TolC
MRLCSYTICLLGGLLIGLSGCAGSRNVTMDQHDSPPISTEPAAEPSSNVLLTAAVAESPANTPPELPPAPDGAAVDVQTIDEQPQPEPIQLNLPTALSMVGGDHPAVGFAQWRVQEAYATLDRAKVLWLPSIQPGFSFHKHDGNYQASNGGIVDVHRNSFQYGLGAGSTGAGTTPRPGVVARFHLADAIFQPKISEKTAWARSHGANGVVNRQLLKVASAYLDLLDAKQDARIVEETQTRTAGLAKLTRDFAATGQGLPADADRIETESMLVESRLAIAHERIDVASAKLSQTLSIDAGRQIVPLDPTVLPIELVSPDFDKASLISTGLENRPELMEAQSLVAAACEQYQRQKYAPFVPSVLLGFSNGGFGGGVGNKLNNVQGRYDFDAILTWEIRNLGFGEGAARRETRARIQQTRYEQVRVLDQVAREIVEAHSQVTHRAKRIDITKNAIQSATNSYERNLSRIRDAQGLPLEVLQSIRALEDASRAYLKAVIEYDQAQFQLQWALGWPVAVPVEAAE